HFAWGAGRIALGTMPSHRGSSGDLRIALPDHDPHPAGNLGQDSGERLVESSERTDAGNSGANAARSGSGRGHSPDHAGGRSCLKEIGNGAIRHRGTENGGCGKSGGAQNLDVARSRGWQTHGTGSIGRISGGVRGPGGCCYGPHTRGIQLREAAGAGRFDKFQDMSPLRSRLAEWLRPSGREKAIAKKIWRNLEKGRTRAYSGRGPLIGPVGYRAWLRHSILISRPFAG